METKFLVLALVFLVLIVLPLTFALWYEWNKKKTSRETQRDLSDPDLIRLIHNENLIV